MTVERYPWHAQPWQSLSARLAAGRLPHALLIGGPAGLGKTALALALAQALLCQNPRADRQACGQCGACRLVASGAHPDLQRVHLEEGSRQIKIDQIRELNAFLGLKSQYGGFRVGVIAPADQMNAAAANGLLKTLEEPPPGAVAILVASRPTALPITVRSRCQQVPVAAPPPEQAAQWLRSQPGGAEAVELLGLAGGSPLAALELAAAGTAARRVELRRTLEELHAGRTTPVEAAERWQAVGSAALVPLLQSLVGDLIRLASLGEAAASGIGDAGRLRALWQGIDLVLLYKYLDRIVEVRRHLNHPLNEQLLLEELFIGWQRLRPSPVSARG